jgi:hypothetical protein
MLLTSGNAWRVFIQIRANEGALLFHPVINCNTDATKPNIARGRAALRDILLAVRLVCKHMDVWVIGLVKYLDPQSQLIPCNSRRNERGDKDSCIDIHPKGVPLPPPLAVIKHHLLISKPRSPWYYHGAVQSRYPKHCLSHLIVIWNRISFRHMSGSKPWRSPHVCLKDSDLCLLNVCM